MSGPVLMQVTNNGTPTTSFTPQGMALSSSFFVFNGGPYVAATHASGAYLGPENLYPGLTTPAKPGDVVVIYANGFDSTSTPVASGAETQSGSLFPLPVIKIGGISTSVQFAGLVSPGQYQLNVAIPFNAPNGDLSIATTYNNQYTQTGTLITVQQ